MNTQTTEIVAGSRVVIVKGCRARSVTKGATAVVKEVTPLGAEYSHTVKVVLWFQNSFLSGKTLAFYARHQNRLSDGLVNLNDGNPIHQIQIRRRDPV